jgi:putative SOS response-associated peptidase YedK
MENTGGEEEEEIVIENISPGYVVPVVRASDNKLLVKEDMIWGLIPKYSKDEKPDHYAVFNKRGESFFEGSKYFFSLLTSQRCVVVLDGFYEWKIIAGKKQPYYVHFSGKPMLMAAIWENFSSCYEDERRKCVTKTFSIVTSEPSSCFKTIHNRQPVFLTDDQAEDWMDPLTPVQKLLEIIKSSNVNEEISASLLFHPVDVRMTNPRYQGSDCSKAINLGKSMTSFFSKALKDPEEPLKSERGRVESVGLPQEKVILQKRCIDEVDLTQSDDDELKVALKVSKDSNPLSPTKQPQKRRKVLPSPKMDRGNLSRFLVKRTDPAI